MSAAFILANLRVFQFFSSRNLLKNAQNHDIKWHAQSARRWTARFGFARSSADLFMAANCAVYKTEVIIRFPYILKFHQNLRNRSPLLRLGKLHEASCMVRTFSSLIYSISTNNHHYHQLRLRWISLIQLCKTRLWEIKALAVHETHPALSIQFDSAKRKNKFGII